MGGWSIVFGIFSMLLCWLFGIGAVPGFFGIVLGAVGRKGGSNAALAGLILSVIGTVVSVIVFFGVVAIANA